jgi:hypothetical protein
MLERDPDIARLAFDQVGAALNAGPLAELNPVVTESLAMRGLAGPAHAGEIDRISRGARKPLGDDARGARRLRRANAGWSRHPGS